MLRIRPGRALLAATFAILLGAGCQQGGTGARAAATPTPAPSSLAERAQKHLQPTSQPVREAPRSPAPPKAAQTGPSLSAVYAGALQTDAQHLVAANGARMSSCATKSLSGCRTALQQVSTSATALQKDLDAHPAPACMKTADATLRAAIGLYQQGAQLGIKGLDEGSSSELTQGKTLLDQGTTRLMAGSAQLGQAGCSVPPPAVAP